MSKENMKDEVWNKMEEDPRAQDFLTVVYQVLNGGFMQLVGNKKEDGAHYLTRNAIAFARFYSPNYGEKFAKVFNEARDYYDDAESYSDKLDDLDSEFYKLEEDLFIDIGKNKYGLFKDDNKPVEVSSYTRNMHE